MTFLIVSIRTIKGIKIAGVPYLFVWIIVAKQYKNQLRAEYATRSVFRVMIQRLN